MYKVVPPTHGLEGNVGARHIYVGLGLKKQNYKVFVGGVLNS